MIPALKSVKNLNKENIVKQRKTTKRKKNKAKGLKVHVKGGVKEVYKEQLKLNT